MLKRLPLLFAILSGLIPQVCAQTYPGIGPSVINVANFPYQADPTGAADSTTAIQNAINALPAVGGIIQFPPGTYKISSSLLVGNGSGSAASTRQGIILQGLGAANTAPVFPGFAATTGPKLLWAGSGANPVINIEGPLQGWGLQNLYIDCASITSSIGVGVQSAQNGETRNLSIINCTKGLQSFTVAPFGSVTNTNSQHNKYYNTTVQVPAVANSVGIFLTGTSSADTDYNTFEGTDIFLPISSIVVSGIDLQATESNAFVNTHMYGGNASSLSITLDYSINSSWPASNFFYHVDPFQSGSGAQWTNLGTPGSGAKPNYIIGLDETNSAACPNLANLSCFESNKIVLSPGGNNTNAQAATDTGGHLGYKGTAPTLTAGCNGAGSSVTGNDSAGFAGGQTAAATSCTLTFAHAFAANPSCVVAGNTGPVSNFQITTTTLVVNFPSTTGYFFSYNCKSIN